MAVGPVWEQDAAGSNPVTRTKTPLKSDDFRGVFFVYCGKREYGHIRRNIFARCICYCEVICYENTIVENVCRMDRIHRSCGVTVRLAHTRGNGALPYVYRAAAAIAARNCVSHRVDDPLRLDGNRSGADLFFSRVG